MRVLKNLSLMMAQERTAESRQKFLKLQKKSFCSTGLSFSSPLSSLPSPNMSLLIARLCPALHRLSTPLRSIQQEGGVATAGKPNNSR